MRKQQSRTISVSRLYAFAFAVRKNSTKLETLHGLHTFRSFTRYHLVNFTLCSYFAFYTIALDVVVAVVVSLFACNSLLSSGK